VSDLERLTPGKLARLGFTDVDATALHWQAVDVADLILLERIASSADPDLAMRGLARVLESLEGDAGELRQALTTDADLALRITRVLGASAALGDHLASHPGDWHELADPSLTRLRPPLPG